MIHPTRTNLLMLREKARSVANSTRILKARKQALIKELLETSRPFLKSREEIRDLYGAALEELALGMGREGTAGVESVAAVARRDFPVEVNNRVIWGLQYKEVTAADEAVRPPQARGYDFCSTTPHIEEAALRFERILGAMIEVAAFESKLKRLGEEILTMTRRIRVLEERVLPELRRTIRTIGNYIGEREREAYFRLKRFKAGGLHPT